MALKLYLNGDGRRSMRNVPWYLVNMLICKGCIGFFRAKWLSECPCRHGQEGV
ncbi:MAG: hypothetical protein H7831_00075 [Magnetococcus sp. WYHC-3]